MDRGAGAGQDFVEDVLALVERIPSGRVMTYGAIAEWLGYGGPRQVGSVMARYGGAVPWHRVVAANGRVVPGHEREALRRLGAEGTPLRGEKVDMPRAAWHPDPATHPDPAPPEPARQRERG
ncbi:MAG: MGMT family protein [Micromonosporaceae bacterium]|nr:MGMT family protein [Micromonosporaceae bacterium]